MINTLKIHLGNTHVGVLTLLSGDKSFFVFEEDYLNDPNRSILSQSYFKIDGSLLNETRISYTKLPSFFSNLLPEGYLRTYLAQKVGIKPSREFKLLEIFGQDLPGAVIASTLDQTEPPDENFTIKQTNDDLYHFSLAGIQIKFSVLAQSNNKFTLPAHGVGGDWIVKLPDQRFPLVPLNEWSMLHLAADIGIPVPENHLVDLTQIDRLPDLGMFSEKKAFVIKRFDREGSRRIHIEDFAQVFNVYPDDKYKKASYANLANMIWILTGKSGLVDFIRRLTFSILIGNGDMHLKNWSLIYPDGKTAELAPAYDFVSTIPYIPNDNLALNLAGTKDMKEISLDHFRKLAEKAQLPETFIIDSVKETIILTLDKWNSHKMNYGLPLEILQCIDNHIKNLSLCSAL